MSTSYNRKPSLDNSFHRVARAEEHLSSLKVAIDKFDSIAPIGHGIQTYGKLPKGLKIAIEYRPDISPMVSILVGEIIYNLRSALDYLVFELALLDSGKVQKGMQFLIENCEQNWNSRERSKLKGLSIKHKGVIHSLQPHRGCEWTKVLASISNPDKHRFLTPINATTTLHIGTQETGEDAPQRAVDVDVPVTHQIAFDDGVPLIETLEILKLKVADVLDMFRSDFK